MKAPMERDERMLLAAELVLGLLDDGERAHALELLAQDPDFAEQVRRWEAHLAPLFAGFAPREPSRDLYPDIRARLNRIDAVRMDRFGAAATDGIADRAPAAANENDAQGVAPGWRWAALGSSAAAAVLAAFLVLGPSLGGGAGAPQTNEVAPNAVAQNEQQEPTGQPAVAPRMVVAQLSGDEGTPQYVASIRQGDPVLRIRLSGDLREAPGTVPVLWVIAGDNPPEAISTFGADQTHTVDRIALKQALIDLIDSGATLAVTFEPADAKTYDAPTTPIVAKGTVSEI